MIISKTPYRISLFGGGSDYPTWYNDNGGCVLGGSIDKYCYISARQLPPFFEHKYRVVYSNIELRNDITSIEHPSVRETLKYLDVIEGMEINHFGDLPARSGIGSSSSFTVGLLNVVSHLYGNKLTKEQLALKSIHIEQNLIQEAVGSQDQTIAAHGGFNFIEFTKNATTITKIQNSNAVNKLNDNLLLFFTGVSRDSTINAKKIINNLSQNKDRIYQMIEYANISKDIIESGSDIDQIGELLHKAWLIKKSYANTITSDHINNIYERALKSGALGGKILGAGGGGFILFYVPKIHQEGVKQALNELIHIDFNFCDEGSSILTSDKYGTLS